MTLSITGNVGELGEVVSPVLKNFHIIDMHVAHAVSVQLWKASGLTLQG